MHGPEKLDPTALTARSQPPTDPEIARPSEFDPVARVYRTAWAVNHANVHRPGVDTSGAAHSDSNRVDRQPFAEDGTRLIRARTTPSLQHAEDTGEASPVSDGLTLDRLYARFEAIARGWVGGDSSAAHRSIVERLVTNQSNAVELGWSNFLVSRRGGTGRLELHGSRSPGQDRELVPDQIPWR